MIDVGFEWFVELFIDRIKIAHVVKLKSVY